MGRVTIRDIARELDLSHTTVSRVLNGREDINIPERTRLRVLEAAQSMGYQPNRAARALATGKTHMLTLLMPNLRSPFYLETLRCSDAWLAEHGYGLDSISMQRTDAHAWQSDGMLALDRTPEEVLKFIAANRLSGTPVVYLGTVPTPGCDNVYVDLRPAAREAVESLVASGRRHIVHLHLPGNDRGAKPDTYGDVLREAGLSPVLICSGDGSKESIRLAVMNYCATHGSPDGIFAEYDDLAIGAYCAMRDLGRRVPDDTAIIGCDGVVDTECFESPLSTIVIPVEEMCDSACEFLLRRIEDPETGIQERVILGSFARRKSS